MATKRAPRARKSLLGFEALTIEGGLLAPEWLSRAAQLAAGQQTEADYRVPKGLNLRDEIGRYWRISQAHFHDFAAGRAAGGDSRALAERFVLALLRDSFGFSSLVAVEPVVVAERNYPIGYAALGGRVPVVIAPAGGGVETAAATFGDGSRRRTPFGLAQEFLNAEENALWGIVTDGVTLRILRDNASLTRPAWIAADLTRIFTEERYADFAALWLIAHETRFGRSDGLATECPLEEWRKAGREEGTRAREHLRTGVEEALLALGQGFLSHPDNQSLRAAFESGELTKEAYFNQLLRLVYRLIFLLTIEERGLLHPSPSDEKAIALYAEGYGLRRLRERSVKRSAHDRFGDLWEGTKIVFRGLAAGEPRLALPALAGIFAKSRTPALDGAKLENRALLLAVFRLAWLREASGLSRVNWRDMGPEEFGSVYESLLELVPQITEGGRKFGFATGGETKGNARKTSGSFFTPDSLVQVLLGSALEPVIAATIAAHPENPAEALLQLSVVDPACGSGHFLLGAARRLAGQVARLEANGTPTAAEYRHALRRVVSRCIFGVDLNPMAVELCQVSLWMEAMEPGLPLTFLDSHIRHGNALLGTTPELMQKGIPDAAWEPIEGDDKKIASLLKKRNKAEASGQQNLGRMFGEEPANESAAVANAVAALEAADDTSAESLAAKESRWGGILDSAEYRHQKLVADAWCAAFVWPKQAGALADAAPTNDLWRQIRDGHGNPPALTEKTTEKLTEQYRFFHWHLAFPQVFAKGGFDVVLGNPPWDSLWFREEEFFAGSRPDIAQAPSAAARKKLVAKLEVEDPLLFAAYSAGLRVVDGMNVLVRSGARYPLCGIGRVNLFALFAEAARALVSRRGRVGQILPSGIVSDDSTKLFFQSVVDQRQLVSFFDFENRDGMFGAVHRSFKFGICTLAGKLPPGAEPDFVFFATRVEHLQDSERRFTLSSEEIALLNPATKNCPIFRSRRDAEITKSIYRWCPVMAQSGWALETRRLLNMSDDSGSFVTEVHPGLVPLYEAKYFHQFDHRWVTHDGGEDRNVTDTEKANPMYSVRSRFWFSDSEMGQRVGTVWRRDWIPAWRRISNSTNERTFIASILPSLAIPNTARVIFLQDRDLGLAPCLLACVNSIAFDYVARQKVGGTDVSDFIVQQLPVLPPSIYASPAPWHQEGLLQTWIHLRVLELTYSAWDLEPFANDVGYNGPPFRWDPERRFLLRCELDAAFFHLYALSREDTDYVMDTFPIVRKNDEKAHGEFRTKRVILEIYDEMAEAIRTARPYQTRLDPVPADSRVAHPPRIVGLPPMPVVVPQAPPGAEAAFVIFALLHAAGGTLTRSDLARAFTLRSNPELLKRWAPASLAEAREWEKKVGQRSVAEGLLASTLKELDDRSGIALGTNADSRSTVSTSPNTPAEEKLDPWFQFEARLALQVLRALSVIERKAVDGAVAGDDRTLLDGVA